MEYIPANKDEHVIAKLRAFKAENGRLPKCTDKKGWDEDAILRGEWILLESRMEHCL